MTWIHLATEDALSEAIGEKLIAEAAPRLEVNLRLRRDGFGYLKARIRKFCEIARHECVLLITDLDAADCAATLVREWTAHNLPPQGLLLRVAVREVESWLLADHDAFRALLRRPQQVLPHNPDEPRDPKQVLIEFTKRGPRALRDAIVPEAGAVASQGLGYNTVLIRFVRTAWSPGRAAQRSDSLARARRRLLDLATSA